MFRTNNTIQSGDLVTIRSLEEIAPTLDPSGTRDGLPFMAEMAAYCGQQFRVARIAEKTCVEYPRRYLMREFRNNDVVVLEMDRCSGAQHDGCERRCVFFWKRAWLRKADEPEAPHASRPAAPRFRKQSGPGKYFCQSTELAAATQPLSRWGVVVKCFREVWSGSRSVPEMAKLVAVPLLHAMTGYRFPRHRPHGNLQRTPSGSQDLQPGDLVRIKPVGEIEATLDWYGRNRGLLCHRLMSRHFGTEQRVVGRLDRMISEVTGQMRESGGGTVILEGLTCSCEYHVGGCPRGDYAYWRELWLDRTGPETLAGKAAEREKQVQ